MLTQPGPLPSAKIIDLTGQTFGRLYVISFAGLKYLKTGGPKAFWNCRCACGKEIERCSSTLRSGNTTSCGCARIETRRIIRHVIDLIGQTFGELTVIELMPCIPSTKKTMWRCRCHCGNDRIIGAGELKSGAIICCEICAKTRRSLLRITHGLRDTQEYQIWAGMHQRCKNPKHKGFENYGGRGITVDPRWDSFENFLQDMGMKPTPAHTLERKDNTLGYSKENTIWATRRTQMRNTRRNVLITIDGQTKCLAEWCEIYELPYANIYHPIKTSDNPAETLLALVKKYNTFKSLNIQPQADRFQEPGNPQRV